MCLAKDVETMGSKLSREVKIRVDYFAGTAYLDVNLIKLKGGWSRTNVSCSYAFIEYDIDGDHSYLEFYRFANNSTQITPDLLRGRTLVALDWRIGAVNCNEARRDPANFTCHANSNCIDFDATVGGYLCNCSDGYRGNPYLTPGCQGW